MTRIRLSVIVGGLAVALAAAPITSYAQQQQRGGGRGNRGGGPGGPGGFGGPGGPGGFGGFGGGPWNSIVSLAGLEPVQKEVKITDAQKTKISKLSQDLDSKRREFFQNLRQQGNASQARLRAEQQNAINNLPQGNQTLDPRDQALASGIGAGGGFGANAFNGGQQEGVDPNVVQQGFRQQQNDLQRQNWEEMRQGMEELQAGSEQSLAKILDRKQVQRLREIQLQVEGPFAVLRPDVSEKLELRDEQAEEIREIQNTANQQRRETMSQSRDIFQSFRNSQQGQTGANDQNPPPANGNGNANAGRGRQGRGNNGGRGPGGNGGNGGPGGPGGPGGNRRFDPEAMRKFMEQPEVKAKMEEMMKQEDALTERSYAMVYKALDRRQASGFKKMLGEPFDVKSVRQGFMRGFGGPGGNRGPAGNGNASENANANSNGGSNSDASNATAKSGETKTDDSNSTSTKTTDKTDTTKSSPAVKSTVRRRGGR
jgi:hypothetical protein